MIGWAKIGFLDWKEPVFEQSGSSSIQRCLLNHMNRSVVEMFCLAKQDNLVEGSSKGTNTAAKSLPPIQLQMSEDTEQNPIAPAKQYPPL